MTLFPEAVLVDTITFWPRATASIAAAWCEYNEVIFREFWSAWRIVSDSGGLGDARELQGQVRAEDKPNPLLLMTPSLESKLLLSTICSLYQSSFMISLITSSMAGLSSEAGTAYRLPLSCLESVDPDIFWEGFTGIWSRLASRSSSTGSSVGGVARISLQQKAF